MLFILNILPIIAERILGAGVPLGKLNGPVSPFLSGETSVPEKEITSLPDQTVNESGRSVIVGIESLARKLEGELNRKMAPMDLLSALRTINANIRAGRPMKKSIEAISKVMKTAEVEKIMMTMRRAEVNMPNSRVLLATTNTYKKFIEMLVQAHGDLKSWEEKKRQKGMVDLEQVFLYFYTNLPRFYDMHFGPG